MNENIGVSEQLKRLVLFNRFLDIIVALPNNKNRTWRNWIHHKVPKIIKTIAQSFNNC